jgi:alginate O-acetyltransferase complex protein AlgI
MGNANFPFLGFGLVVALLYNLNGSVLWRQSVLLCAGLVMVGTFSTDPVVLLPFAIFCLLGFAALRLVERDAKRWLAPSLVTVIVAFIWLKQYRLIPPSLFLTFPYLTVGLSYILFRILHLIIDRSGEQDEPPVTLARYLAYLVNFTTLVSGPIQRYSDLRRTRSRRSASR